MRFNDHPPHSLDYKIQAIQDAAEQDAGSYRYKNEREHCYTAQDINRLASDSANQRYVSSGTDYINPEKQAAMDVYQMVFTNQVRRSDQ